MEILTEEEFLKLTQLCRIECTDEEKKTLCSNISKILAYIDLLQEVDTKDVPPCSQVMELLSNVMREDKVGPALPREEFLFNAPAHIGGMIRVPPIIHSKSSN